MEINALTILNTLILTGIVISAFMAMHFENLLASIISLGITGALVAIAFLVLQAPDVALAEAAVGAVLSTTIFIIALRKIKPGHKGGEEQK